MGVDGHSPVGSAPGFTIYDEGGHNEDEAEFIALARNAFDVLMRTDFAVIKTGEGEFSVQRNGGVMGTIWIGITGQNWREFKGERLTWPDPFTAVVEAEKWYNENVEQEKS